MRRCLTLAAFLAVVFPASTSIAIGEPSAQYNSIERHIRAIENHILPSVIVLGMSAPNMTLAERMKTLHVPGVSIAYIHDGRIQWARGFGVTRIGGPPVTTTTLFQAASISKSVTATAVLHLVETGKLDLDTDVNQYLKSWKIPANKFTEYNKITLRELLSHTAGMTVHGFAGYASDEPVPTLIQVLNGEKPANSPAIVVDTAPGSAFSYSGGGYVVTQQLLDDVTRIPFPKLMHDTVLGPLSMMHSTYEQPLPTNRVPEAAMPYSDYGAPVRGGAHTYPEMAPAGLWTTPTDLAHFAINLQKLLAGKSGRVLTLAMAHQMITPSGHETGVSFGGVSNGYGLGLVVAGGNHRLFWHDGGNAGFESMLIAYDEGDGIVIMTNGDDGDVLIHDILRTVAHEYCWPNFQPKVVVPDNPDVKLLDEYVGHYKTNEGSIYAITRQGDQLFERSLGRPIFELLPKDKYNFFLSGYSPFDAQLKFIVGADGRSASIIIHNSFNIVHHTGTDTTANRIDDTDPQAAWADDVFKKVDAQVQSPGTEAALRKLIEQLRNGQPDYDRIDASFGKALRQDVSQDQKNLEELGALKTLSFMGVSAAGNDIYKARFANGWTEWRIGLTSDGKIRIASLSMD